MAQRVEHHPLDAAFAALLTNGLDGAGEALRILVNAASRIERNQFLNAQPHERTAERTDYANGFKPKTMMTRVGELTFDVPQVRGGGFYPGALEKGSRTEQALNIALAEMYVQGVSTRKVITVLQALLGPEVSISSTQVSRAAEQLDAGLAAWRERPLDETPYVFLDARYERVREGGQLVDCAVLVAVGITHSGHRRVLGVSVALSEAEVHWRAFLDSLVRRGLKGVKMIVADAHAGLNAAHAVRPCPACLGSAVSSTCNRTRSRISPASTSASPWRSGFGPSSMHRTAPRQSVSCARPSWTGAPKHPSWLSGPRKICLRALLHSVCRWHNAFGYAQPTASNALTAKSNAVPVSLPSSPTRPPACAWSRRCSPNAMRTG